MLISKLIKSRAAKICQKSLIFLLIFAWIFSGWPLVQAEETATSTGVAVSIDATSTPTSTDQIITQQPADEENAPEEIMPSPEPPQPDLPPLTERKFDKRVAIARGAPHFCRSENFTVRVSHGSSARLRVALEGKEIQNGELEIGSLPFGVEAAFSQSGDYLNRVSKNDRVSELEFVSREGSQRGSFSISVFYTDTNTNQTTACQINLINV